MGDDRNKLLDRCGVSNWIGCLKARGTDLNDAWDVFMLQCGCLAAGLVAVRSSWGCCVWGFVFGGREITRNRVWVLMFSMYTLLRLCSSWCKPFVMLLRFYLRRL